MSPKLPVGTREGDRPRGRAERDGGGEVVDDLGDDPGPVDRVDAGERQPVAEVAVVEQRLHHRLAVVEGALDGERMDVGRAGRRHLPLLDGRHPALGEEDEDVDVRSRPAKASIAAPPVSPEVAPTMVTRSPRSAEDMVHQPRQQLHRDVLEGERRAVEQLEHPLARADLRPAARSPGGGTAA